MLDRPKARKLYQQRHVTQYLSAETCHTDFIFACKNENASSRTLMLLPNTNSRLVSTFWLVPGALQTLTNGRRSVKENYILSVKENYILWYG